VLTGEAVRRVVTVAVAATMGVVGVAGTAVADPNSWVDCEQLPDHPDCELGAETEAGSLEVGPGGDVVCRWDGEEVPCRDDWGWWGGDGCYYRQDGEAPPPSGTREPGAAYQPRCLGDPAGSSRPLVWIPDSQAPGPAELGRIATSRLVLPEPEVRLAPPLPAAQLVGLPTWWWIDEQVWRPRSASASIPGVITVTAVGRPVASVWQTGDGGQVHCDGPGTPYPEGSATAAGSACGHVYQRSSASQPSGAYPVSVTITWEVTWSGGGASGSAGPLFSSTTVEVPVAEVQSVIVP
jgi:hypothetical protein